MRSTVRGVRGVRSVRSGRSGKLGQCGRIALSICSVLILCYCAQKILLETSINQSPEPPKKRHTNNHGVQRPKKKKGPQRNHRDRLPLIRSDLKELAEYHAGKIKPLKRKINNNDKEKKNSPNFVLMVLDDSGYGDLGVNVAKLKPDHVSNTPHLDNLALHGVRFTDFYVTCSICTPSRASLLTGRYGQRTGMVGHIAPKSSGGLPPTEYTLASHLKKVGYDSIVLGKWHLGHVRPHDPLSHGFDEWLGIPFSNDMGYR
mmetsp:Transcript_52988/g.67924  ORF Transcript_52988/g.67924 Transcript_52988/m.67924 type:complete len:259 (+) Transcript_52988:71-847(+)